MRFWKRGCCAGYADAVEAGRAVSVERGAIPEGGLRRAEAGAGLALRKWRRGRFRQWARRPGRGGMRHALCGALLALALGGLLVLQPGLPDAALRYVAAALRRLPGAASAEGSVAAAWDALILRPARRWGRVAVG